MSRLGRSAGTAPGPALFWYPAPMPLGFLAGVAGTAAAAAGMARTFSRRRREYLEPVARDPACAVAIVLMEPHDAGARAIDQTTGRLGFSHAALQGCEQDEQGRSLLLDCQVGHGVTRRPVSAYKGRRLSRVYLPGEAAAEAYGCMRARVGQDFDPSRGASGWTCADLIADCLPAELRGLILRERRFSGPGGMVSPNQIAAAFGVAPGSDVVVW